MSYEKEILETLTLAGNKGLKLEKIARHVFNACNSMFNPLDYKDVYGYVSQFLIKCSKDEKSLVEKCGYGVYRLNLDAYEARQLLLEFTEDKSALPTKEPNNDDDSLSLFPSFFS